MSKGGGQPVPRIRRERAKPLPGAEITIATLVSDLEAALKAGRTASTAGADAFEIVSILLDTARSWPKANRSVAASSDLIHRARSAAAKRSLGAPLGYATGVSAFRHLNLFVDERVLIPRAETEVLVDQVLSRTRTGTVVDVGTGSGAIALALASEGDFTLILATDISQDALAVARENWRRLKSICKCPVEFRHGSLLSPLDGEHVSVIVSNPPYVSPDEIAELEESVRDWEPPLALFADEDGMAAIAQIIQQSADILEPAGLLALEVDFRRAGRVAELAAANGAYCDISVSPDLTGRDRFVTASRNR